MFMLKRTLAVAVLAVGSVLFVAAQQAQAPGPTQTVEEATHQTRDPAPQKQSNKLATYTAQEFKRMFDGLSLPNTKTVVEPPEITGNQAADRRIIRLAEKRGYKLRLIARGGLVDLEGHQVQPLLIENWQNMKKAAAKDGIRLKIVSGYRPVDEQKEILQERLQTRGLTPAKINSGTADVAIDAVLQYVAPPGYSRHHSGYTLDVADPSSAVFAYSQAYTWLSADNFKNAKRFGFIPSYPEGATNQGPEPEPWEYVWVNRDFLLE